MTLSNKAQAFSVVNLLKLPVEAAHSGYDANQCQDSRDVSLLDMKARNKDVRSALADVHPEDAIRNIAICEAGKEIRISVGCNYQNSGVAADVTRSEQLLKRRPGSDLPLRYRPPCKVRCYGSDRHSRPAENGAHLCRKQRPGSKSERLRQGSSTDVCGTTCFCHGEIMYCQHPSLQSVTDTNGSGLSALVELCHSDLWTSFHRLGTEMIITKSGRRMFPVLKLRVSGLSRDKMYSVRLEFCQPDTRKYRYIYNNSRWMVSGSGDALATKPCHFIPEGPLSGQALCSQILSFERVKMTNSESTKPCHVSLVSMQKFQPQIVIEEVPGPLSIVSATLEHYVVMFPQTSFMAVTAYQNQQYGGGAVENIILPRPTTWSKNVWVATVEERYQRAYLTTKTIELFLKITSKQDQITTLKIASNPFAKGFRESGKARVTYETLAAQYSGFVPQKSYSPVLATSAHLRSGFFRRGMPDVGSYIAADERAYLEALNRDKNYKYSQMEDEKILQLLHQPRTTSSAYHCYPMYYSPFSPSFASQGQKWNNFENLNADSYVDNTLLLHKTISSDNTTDHHRILISSPLNLAVTPSCGESEKLERTSTGHFGEKLLQTCRQYRYHPHAFPSVQKSITSNQGIALLHPYGQLYSDNNISLRITSDQQELEARASRSNMSSLDFTRSQSARLSRSSSRESLVGPTRCNTEPSATSCLPIIKHLGYESTSSVR